MSDLTRDIVNYLKEVDFCDLGFLFEPKPASEAFSNSLLRRLYGKGGDAFLSVYLDCMFFDFLKESSVDYMSILTDFDSLLSKREELVRHATKLDYYHSKSGGSMVKKSILTIAASLKNGDFSEGDYHACEPYRLFLSSNDFIEKKLTVKAVGEMSSNPLLPNKFDKLLYVFSTTLAASQFIEQANEGLYVLCVKDNNKTSSIHFMIGVKFSNGGGVIMSDGNYDPTKRSRSERNDIHRIEQSFFPYSLTNIVFDGNYVVEAGSDSFSLVKSDGFEHKDFLGYKELSGMAIDDAARLSIFINQLFALDWNGYVSSPKVNSKKLAIRVETEVDDKASTNLTIREGEILLPKQVSRDSYLEAVRSKDLKKNGGKYFTHSSPSNKYWEDVFPDALSEVVITDDKLIEKKTTSKNTVLVPISEASEMANSEDVVVHTLRTARTKQADKLKDRIDDYFKDNHASMRQWLCEKSSEEDVFNSILKRVASLSDIDDAYELVSGEDKNLCRLGITEGYKVHKFDENGYQAASGGLCVPNCVGSKDDYFLCAVNGKKAKFNFIYQFNDGFDISTILGVSLNELPFHLSQFGVRFKTGNSILDDIDPVESMRHSFLATNQYSNRLSVSIPLSLSGFNTIRQKHGLEKVSASELKVIAKNKEYRVFG